MSSPRPDPLNARADTRRPAGAAAAWALLAVLALVPVAIAAANPLLAFRPAVYILGGMAGVAALALLLFQPLLAAGYLPAPNRAVQRRWHHRLGAALTGLVALHIGGLYLTSPPDALDALLLRSPTPFSVWGVLAMWAVFFTALLAAARARLRLRPVTWNIAHNALALVVVLGTVIHALQIEGAMGPVSKWALCLAVLAVTAGTLVHLRILRPLGWGSAR